MMAVAGVAANPAVIGPEARNTVRPGAAAQAGRALVAITPVAPPAAAARSLHRAFAPLLAQLIATDRQLPQTRGRNRAEPGDAVAAYAAVEKMLAPALHACKVRKSGSH
jgi:hypothetical protein